MKILQARSTLARLLGPAGCDFLGHAAGAVTRLLPNVVVGKWIAARDPLVGGRAVWDSRQRQAVRLELAWPDPSGNGKPPYSLAALATRRGAGGRYSVSRTIDEAEKTICHEIMSRINRTLTFEARDTPKESLAALSISFDEQIVASYLQKLGVYGVSIPTVLRELRVLAEQTYENKAMAFGCILESAHRQRLSVNGDFPRPLLDKKRYRALTDGFRTAYLIGSNGSVNELVDLTASRAAHPVRASHAPEWAVDIAAQTMNSRLAFALTRAGDVLVFRNRSVMWTYRFGRWQYWSHGHLINIITRLIRRQRVARATAGRLAAAIYRCATDVSFRRTGGLFVVLRARNMLRDVVRSGDAITDATREAIDANFDRSLPTGHFVNMPRPVAAELAGLDGAIVMDSTGRILAYGAILQPKRHGRLGATEGSRTKAAKGASYFGTAVKVSADGDIAVYADGVEVLRM